ncbi:hypothetical protein F443_22482 [Phytophthora nicotianae P1569]|uniref:Uncharacterized protein n=1 Tax=Phytophthora nicotianae P1569 TaxID=1317065 RepID=V9DWN2_PHYNI|nr:hypothetical protein F443_22482 [Phytophthora nicotianae P1569]
MLVTAASTRYLPQQHRGQRRKPRHRRRRFCKNDSRKRIEKNQHGQRVIGVSTAEYYHLSKFNKKRVCDLNLKKKEPVYALILKEMPSFKTLTFMILNHKFEDAGAGCYCQAPCSELECAGLHRIWCLELQDGLRGNPRAPVQALKKELERRATVLPMNEFFAPVSCAPAATITSFQLGY